jgi:hypothetical protein
VSTAEAPHDATLVARLEHIRKLTDEFLNVQDDTHRAKHLARVISREIDAARVAIKRSR